MATYIKTLAFSTRGIVNPGIGRGGFNSPGDDSRLNAALQQLQSQGAKIIDVKVALGAVFRLPFSLAS